MPSFFSPSKVLALENQYRNLYMSSSDQDLESPLLMEFCAPENHPVQEIQAMEDESPRKRWRQESTTERSIQLAPIQELLQEPSTALSLVPQAQHLVPQSPPSFFDQFILQETPTEELPIQVAPRTFSSSPGELLAQDNQYDLYLEPLLMKSYVPEQIPVQETTTEKPIIEIVGQTSPLNNAQENQYLDICNPFEYYSEYPNLQFPDTAEEDLFTTFPYLLESHWDHPSWDVGSSSQTAYQSYSDNPIPDMGTQSQNQYLSYVDYTLLEPDKASYSDNPVVDLHEANQVPYQSHSDNLLPDQGIGWNMFPDQGSISTIPFLEWENQQQHQGAAGQNQITYDTGENYESDYELDYESADNEFVDYLFE